MKNKIKEEVLKEVSFWDTWDKDVFINRVVDLTTKKICEEIEKYINEQKRKYKYCETLLTKRLSKNAGMSKAEDNIEVALELLSKIRGEEG